MTRHPVFTVLLAAFVGLSVWLIFIWRAHENSLTSMKLCLALVTIIQNNDKTLGDPGTPGHEYYLSHPDELSAAHKATVDFLAKLPCKP